MIPTPSDSWAIARFMSDQPVNGELAIVSDPFRPLAELLAATPFPDRGRILDVFLAGRADRDAILRAVADAEPTGPPPAPEATAPASDWPPLRLEGLPTVEPFPVDVLPEPAARLVRAGADAIGCPRDFLGLPVLAVAGGTIGRSVSLMIKPRYFASTGIYGINIGPPSDGKTPAQKAVVEAAREISDQLAAEHARELERWSQEAAATARGSKPPPPPKPRRIDIDDATMEVLPLILADNPRGLFMARDELTALILGLNQYKAGGKGSDRSNLLKMWSGERIIKDRVNHEGNIPIRCPHPSLSIMGGMPPDMLGELADPKGRADGLTDRFLMAYPDPLPVAPWSDNGIPDDVSADWCSLIALLWMRPMDVKDGRSVPHVAHFTPEGKARWTELYDVHTAEMNAPDFPPNLRGPWGKLREYVGRFCLILPLMHHAAWCLADPDADPLVVPRVTPARVDDAWRLVRYFKSQARRVHAAIASGPVTGEMRVVRAIVDWVQAGQRTSFTEHEFKQARRWVEDDELEAAAEYLIGRSAIRPQQAPTSNRKAGRPALPSYDVNPALLLTRNP